MVRILLLKKLIMLMTLLAGLLSHQGKLGALFPVTMTLPAFTVPAASTTSATPFSVQPVVTIISSTQVQIAETGSFDSCVSWINDQTATNSILTFSIKPKTAYAYSLTCKNNDIQPVRYVGSFVTP